MTDLPRPPVSTDEATLQALVDEGLRLAADVIGRLRVAAGDVAQADIDLAASSIVVETDDRSATDGLVRLTAMMALRGAASLVGDEVPSDAED